MKLLYVTDNSWGEMLTKGGERWGREGSSKGDRAERARLAAPLMD